MKAKGKISLFVFILLFSLCRCEMLENETNYILVTVDLGVYVLDWRSGPTKPAVGISVNMFIQKAGGEKVEGTGTTGSDGMTSIVGTFKLYKEQPIEAGARLVDKPDVIKWQTISWEAVEKQATEPDDEGLRTYHWHPLLSFDID